MFYFKNVIDVSETGIWFSFKKNSLWEQLILVLIYWIIYTKILKIKVKSKKVKSTNLLKSTEIINHTKKMKSKKLNTKVSKC